MGTSLLLGYHLDQRSADRVLAEKSGRPDQVLIQDFIPEIHMNMLKEVHALGQTVREDSIRLNIGSGEEPRWITVTPVYAVGAEHLPIAKQHLNTARGAHLRPMPRASAEQLRRQRLEIERISDMALAFAIEEAPSPDASLTETAGGPFRVLSDDGASRLVEVVGGIVTGNSLRRKISDALLASGTPSVPDSLLIAPSDLISLPASSDHAVIHIRWWLAFVGALLAFGALFAPGLAARMASGLKKPTSVQQVEAHGAFPAIGIFQPIASQDELSMDEERAQIDNGPGAQIRRRLSSLTDFTASNFGGVRSPR